MLPTPSPCGPPAPARAWGELGAVHTGSQFPRCCALCSVNRTGHLRGPGPDPSCTRGSQGKCCWPLPSSGPGRAVGAGSRCPAPPLGAQAPGSSLGSPLRCCLSVVGLNGACSLRCLDSLGFFSCCCCEGTRGDRVGGLRGAGAAPHLCDGVVTPPSRRSMCGAQRPAPPPTRLAGGRPSGGGRAGGLQDTRAGPASCSAARQACGSLTAELLFRPAWGTARPPRGSAWPGGASVQRALLEPRWEPGGLPPGSSPAPSGRHVWQLPVICVLRTLSGSRLDQKWLESLGEGQAFPGWVAAFVGGSLGPPPPPRAPEETQRWVDRWTAGP